jgi:hypothetical protein
MQPRIQIQGGVPAIVNTPTTWTAPVFLNGTPSASIATKLTFTQYADAAPAVGDFFFDMTQNAISFEAGETGNPSVEEYLSGVIAVQKQNMNVTFTAAATQYSTLPAAMLIGNTTIPQNLWALGKTIRLKQILDFTIGALADTFTLNVYLNNIPTGTLTIPTAAATTQMTVNLEAVITCVALGAGGTAEFLVGFMGKATNLLTGVDIPAIFLSSAGFTSPSFGTTTPLTVNLKGAFANNGNTLVGILTTTMELLA